MENRTLSGNKPKRKVFVEIAASLLLIFFVHSAINTYIAFNGLRNMLAFYTFHTTGVASAIVISEIITAILLFIPRTRTTGFICAILFALTAAIIILRTPHYPHDFGGIFNVITKNQKWMLLAFLLLLSTIGIILSIKKGKPSNQSPLSNHVVYT